MSNISKNCATSAQLVQDLHALRSL